MDSFKLFLESTIVESMWRGLEQAAEKGDFNASDFGVLADAIEEEIGGDGAGLRWMATNNVKPAKYTSKWWYWTDGGIFDPNPVLPQTIDASEVNSSGCYSWWLSPEAIKMLYGGNGNLYLSIKTYPSFRQAVEALLALHPETTPGILPEPRRITHG